MKIALEGKRVLIIGASGRLHDAIGRALAESGAALESASPHAGTPWLLVNISRGAEIGPMSDDEAIDSELAQFASATRTLGARRVINVISAAGVVPVRDAAAFSARQASLASLTRGLAMELGPEILVNALAVGAVTGDAAAERFVSHSPLKRAATAGEIANAALFLADPMNSYTTGHVMSVDGGWSIGYARDF
jgi:NAD(P)-dependent dehydrogenase (short-subunit alcohol dehydrogenase family)